MFSAINRELLRIYQSVQEKTVAFRKKCEANYAELDGKKEYFCQYFFCPQEYAQSKTKVMIAGQQASFWQYDPELTIDESIAWTKNFLYKDRRRSAFWNFCYEFEKIINNNGDGCFGENSFNKHSFFYSNVFRIANLADPEYMLKKDALVKEYLADIQTLSAEIQTVAPDIVLFLTGPEYDRFLADIFKKATFEQASGSYSKRSLAKIRHEMLPDNTFRLYHPRYVQWRHLDYLWTPLMWEIKKEYFN